MSLMGYALPEQYQQTQIWYTKRDEIMQWLSGIIIQKTTEEWLAVFEPEDIWCAPVYGYEQLLNHEGYIALQMDQEVETSNGEVLKTTRCPIRIDGKRICSRKSAPKVGEDNDRIELEFNL